MTGESDRVAAESSRIGAEGGRISAEGGRVLAAKDRAEDYKHMQDGRFRKDLGQALAYVLIVAVAAYGFWADNRSDERNHAEICATANENREAIRGVVLAVKVLGENLIVEGKPESNWTDGEREAVADLAEFQEAQFALLDQPIC